MIENTPITEPSPDCRNNYEKVGEFLKEKIFGKFLEKILPDTFEFTAKTIAKIWGKKVATKFTKNVIIDRATKDFTLYRLISNFTSLGSVIALLFDVLDGKPNGYTTIKVR